LRDLANEHGLPASDQMPAVRLSRLLTAVIVVCLAGA
jgi:hypothetical protein